MAGVHGGTSGPSVSAPEGKTLRHMGNGLQIFLVVRTWPDRQGTMAWTAGHCGHPAAPCALRRVRSL